MVDFRKIEKKWQKKWEEKKVFEVKENSKRKKYYIMEMFPYPSALGLHLGHALNYTIGDILARFKRMKGFNVLYPMGFDALGLPAENAAIKARKHPKPYTIQAIKNYIKQMKELGFSYDWDKLVNSMEPEYYKWNQVFFLKFLEKGLAYRKKAAVNWCPKCNTVLANEQVVGGCCWRHEDTEVEIKHLEQWFLKITDYAEELLDCIDGLKWPQKIKTMQRNWIGKSHGTEIDFDVENSKEKFILVDAVHCLVDKEGNVNQKLKTYLDSLKNRKIVLTNAPFEKHKKFFRNIKDYEIFTLEFKPEKNNPEYYKKFLKKFNLSASDVIYFEHDKEAFNSAKSVGIGTFFYENNVEDVKKFIKDSLNNKWPVFTTRPDTIYGVTFMVISAQHPKLMGLVKEGQKKDVEKFLKKIKSVSEKEIEILEKEGVFTGSYAVNPVNGEKVPIWVGNFVLAEYGSGMVMGVPAHDQRDFEFAKKYSIPIREVIKPVFGKPRKDSEYRKTVSVIVHRKKDNKFLFVKWKKFDWVAPVVGGIDGKEFPEKTAEREVLEETGYKVKAIKKLGVEVDSHFFADNKDVWRHRVDQPVLCELLNDKPKKISEKEKSRHDAIWLTSEEAFEKITHKDNLIGLSRYLGNNKAYVEEGVLVNSGKFDGMDSKKAIDEITKFLSGKKLGKKTIQYKLRDWLISRQRYWGTPIPVVYCDKCGIVPVPEKELPIILPEKVKFGKGNPLETNEKFVNVKCPKCRGKARRETDTMDTFVDSSWYFMRYPDNKNSKKPFDKKIENYWLPVDQYIGGIEHATMHLLYARFWTKALRDLGYVKYDEPFLKLFNQGMLHGEDGEKMSKSKGNVILPEVVSKKYGIDTARFFLMSLAAPDKPRDWSDKGVQGSLRFINKVMEHFDKIKIGKSDKRIESKLNKTIKEVTEHIEDFKYNLAIIKIRDLFNSFGEEESKDVLEKSLLLLHPFCPHITEELWEKIKGKGFISLAKWPEIDKKKIDKKFEEEEKSVEKLKEDIANIRKITGKKKGKVYVYVIPKEVELYKDVENVEVFAVNDKDKHDPEGKAKKAKFGRPSIYLE